MSAGAYGHLGSSAVHHQGVATAGPHRNGAAGSTHAGSIAPAGGGGAYSRALTALLGLTAAPVLAVALIHLLAPASAANGWLSTRLFLAHGLAFPLPFGGALAAFGLLGLALHLALRARRSAAEWPAAQRRAERGGGRAGRHARAGAWLGLVLAGAVLAACATGIGLLAPARAGDEASAWSDPSAWSAPSGPADGGALRLVEWNALNSFDTGDAHRFFGRYDADVGVFPEFFEWQTGGPGGSRMLDLISAAGLEPREYEVFVSPSTGGIAPVTVVVRRDLGYRRLTGAQEPAQTRYGTIQLTSDAPGVPDLLGVHTLSPMPSRVPQWARDLEILGGLADGQAREAVIIGDVNATLRHGAVGAISTRTHADALLATPPAQRGTWPSDIPLALRSPIDHVLVPPSVAVTGARVLEAQGSDHAPVIVEVRVGDDTERN